MASSLLAVSNLNVRFPTRDGVVKAVNGIDLELERRKVLGLVGESGSGKTMTALSVMGMIPPPGRIVEGRVLFNGEDLLIKSEDELREIRGNKIAMIFQDPLTSLNPVFTVGEQVGEALEVHRGLSKSAARENVAELLEKVGIPSASKRIDSYPHEFSGGMRQRVMIAMALSCRPSLLIADEPTTALDVTVQAQVLELMKALKNEFAMSILFITHNLSVIAEMADYVAVMYAGSIVEYGDVFTIFQRPLHPYTQALMAATPNIKSTDTRLQVIGGNVPDLRVVPSGCPFHPRCPLRMDVCPVERPQLELAAGKGHMVACHAVRENATVS